MEYLKSQFLKVFQPIVDVTNKFFGGQIFFSEMTQVTYFLIAKECFPCQIFLEFSNFHLVNIYLFKLSNQNTGKCEICPNSTIKTEGRQ